MGKKRFPHVIFLVDETVEINNESRKKKELCRLNIVFTSSSMSSEHRLTLI